MIKGLYNTFLIGKKNIRSSYDWGQEIKTLGDLKSLTESASPLVSPDTSKSDFLVRHKHLTWAKYACLMALIFSATKIFGVQPVYGTISASLAAFIFTVTYVQMAYKSWVCQYIWANWDKRAKLRKPRFGKFVSNILRNPILFFAYKLD